MPQDRFHLEKERAKLIPRHDKSTSKEESGNKSSPEKVLETNLSGDHLVGEIISKVIQAVRHLDGVVS